MQARWRRCAKVSSDGGEDDGMTLIAMCRGMSVKCSWMREWNGACHCWAISSYVG
jgi:hypothetical protein